MLTKSYTQKLPHALNELVDNSLAAFATTTNDMIIAITIAKEGDLYRLSVSDNGPGIPLAHIPAALSAGKAKRAGLNEHGLGIKNVLAFGCPDNTGFELISVPVGSEKAYKIRAPWTSPFLCEEVSAAEHPYPSGFTVSMLVTENIMRSYASRGFKMETMINRLAHSIAVTYARHPLLTHPRRSMHFTLNGDRIQPEGPQHISRVALEKGEKLSLLPGSPEVFIQLKHYRLAKPNDNARAGFFQCNIHTSGFYLYLHNRLIKILSVKDVYDIENHNSFNSFACIVDIEGDPLGIPSTMTTKNGLLETDPLTQALYEYLRKIIPAADAKGSMEDPRDCSEKEMVANFCEMRKANAADFGPGYELTEERAFEMEGGLKTPSIDVCEVFATKVNLYEAKRDTCTVDDIMQLWRNYRFMQRVPGLTGKEIHCILLTTATEPNAAAALILEDLCAMDPSFRFSIKPWAFYGISRTR